MAKKKTAKKETLVTADEMPVEEYDATRYTPWIPGNMPVGGKSNSTEQLDDHPTEHNHSAEAISDIVDRFADLRLYVPAANSCGVDGNLQVGGRVSFGATSAGDWLLKLYDGSPTYFHGIGVGENSLTFHVSETLAAELRPNGWVFNVADGIDTADILDRADVATMPVLDDDGAATADAEVDSLTFNEVMTAMLAKIKELSAEVKDLRQRVAELEARLKPATTDV